MMWIPGTGVSGTGDPMSTKEVEGPAARMPSIGATMTGKEIRHFNVWSLPTDLTLVSNWYNNVQLLA